MPRIVHITTVPQSLTSYLRGLVEYLEARGFELAAISSPGERLDKFAREQPSVQVIPVEMPRKIAPGDDVRALVPLVAALRRLRPAIVHAHTPKGGLLGMLAARAAGVPVRIYHMRGLPMETAQGWRRELLRWAERTSCHVATDVLCVSASLREVAIRERLCRASKIEVLASGSGQGVDTTGMFAPEHASATIGAATRARLGIPAGAVVVGYLGRLVRDKGIVELVEAWTRVAAAHPHAHLLIVGELEQRDALPVETVARLRQDPRVHMTGFDWDVVPLYAAMDLVVLPTHREGFPNVPLEAASLCKPVVATRATGCVDAIEDGVTGTLVPVGDAAGLARALARYVEDPALRLRHGLAARARVVERFAREVIWEALYEKYRACLRRQDGVVGSGDFSE